MSPRLYRAPQRHAARKETRRRIVDAVVKLHAEQGVTRTTYAMIAKRADVAVPTVYNHFPMLSDLLAACTGDVLAGAPSLAPQIFDEAPDLVSRLHALTRSLSAYYRYLAPWLRWSVYEAVLVREIAARLARMSEARRQLILMALAPAFGRHPPDTLVAVCEVLLDFPSWQRLARDGNASADEVESMLAEALVALAHAHLPAMGRASVKLSKSRQGGNHDKPKRNRSRHPPHQLLG